MALPDHVKALMAHLVSECMRFGVQRSADNPNHRETSAEIVAALMAAAHHVALAHGDEAVYERILGMAEAMLDKEYGKAGVSKLIH